MCDYAEQTSEKAYYAANSAQQNTALGGSLSSLQRKTSPAEQHAAEEKSLLERAAQHARAAKFFAAHPEFAEFIELRNQGIL